MCFSCGKLGHGVGRCLTLDETFPYMLPEMVGGEGEHQLHDDLAKCCIGMPLGLIREGVSAARISNELRPPPDHGGGVRLTTSRTKLFVPPSDTQGQHACFPLAQGLVKQPVPRPAHLIPEPVNSPVPAGHAGANSST